MEVEGNNSIPASHRGHAVHSPQLQQHHQHQQQPQQQQQQSPQYLQPTSSGGGSWREASPSAAALADLDGQGPGRRLVRGRRRAGSEASAFPPVPVAAAGTHPSQAGAAMASSSSTSTSMSSLSDSGEQRAQRSSLSTPPLHYHHQQRTSSMAQQQHHHTHSSPLAQHQLTSAQYHDELERLHSPLLGDAPQQHPGGLQLPLGIPAPLSQQQQQQQQQMMHHHHHQQQTQQQQHYGQAQRQNSGIVPQQQHHHHHQQQQQQHYGAQQQLQAVKQPPFGEQDMDEDQLGGEKEENVKREGGLREPTGTTCPEFSFNLQGLYPAELREDGVRFSVMYQVRFASAAAIAHASLNAGVVCVRACVSCGGQVHYVRIFEEADAVRLDGVREAVTSFWPKTRRFFSLFQSPIIVHQIVNIDYMLYDVRIFSIFLFIYYY
jgi:hypothetical protein